ncbi:MAG: NAD(P)/FAD-dependent oxidoreductase [Alphaproteobacteria bacterium]|nr:NAD(P)/FAD-dependent oxidoreductase [Alphaproteobacteria bacterium]
MSDAEVVVVGGGPGGCAAALHLARAGREVILVDRARFPRPKVCGEGLMPVGVAELERLGLELAIDAQPFHGIRYAVGDRVAEGRFPGGRSGLGVRRERLDRALNEAASAAGVDVRHGVQVRALLGSGGRRVVRTSAGDLRCRAVVAADGMRSPIRRALGLESPRRGRPRYGLRGHLRLAGTAPVLDVVEVRVEDGLELYLTPVGDRELNVAVLLEKQASRDLRGDLEGGFARILSGVPAMAPWLDGAVPDGPVGLTGPLRQEAIDVVADGVVLVGDAAGFLDGITGEGMSLTLTSARLAAETLDGALERGDVSVAALRSYATARARAAFDLTLLTEIVLAGIRNRWLARRVVGGLARHPDVFGRVLGVSSGGRVVDVGLGGLLRVLAA